MFTDVPWYLIPQTAANGISNINVGNFFRNLYIIACALKATLLLRHIIIKPHYQSAYTVETRYLFTLDERTQSFFPQF